jgi:excisionase family DNA binding protein
VPTAQQPLRLTDRLALRPKEAAEALGVSERTIRTWMKDEELPHFRLNGVVLIQRSTLQEWMQERETCTARADSLADEILEELGE